jgi:hypothetical protein
MLKIDDLRTLHGYQVNGDDTSPNVFYIFPNSPTLARMDTGGLALRFVEYGQLREEGGKKFGGFVAFDAELSVPAADQQKIVADLQAELAQRFQGRNQPPQPVQIAPINYVDGTVELLLTEGGALIEKVRGAGKPSLYGRNIAAFQLELSELGTAIFKETLSTGAASGVQVVYKLNFYARLPEMNARGEWHAREFYSFFQDINTEDNFWSEDSYTEVVSSSRYKNDVTKTHFNFIQAPNLKPEDQAKLEADIRATINKQLEAAVQRNLLKEIQDVDPNTKELQEGQDIEDIRRTIKKTQMADVVVEWSESKAVIINKNPQGMLPSVTSIKGANNQALKWEDYYSKINVDEFLKTLQVTVQVNVDFVRLPVHSVEVKLNYPLGPNAKVQEFVLAKADDVKKFECFVHQGIRKFKYSYVVNYKNSTASFRSPEVEVDDTQLVINVDDLGILALDIAPGDINFAQVERAMITVRYDNAGSPIEKKFNMTKDAQTFTVREVLGRPRSGPVKVRLTYQMADGREIKGPEREQLAQELYIDDPFIAMKTVSFRAVGDLDNDVASIALSAVYVDAANNYRQSKEMALSKATPFMDWTFPVIDESAGTLTYSGAVTFKTGATRDVPETVARRAVVQVGNSVAKFLEITAVPDLIDWALVKLVNLSLAYEDAANGVNERTDLRFKKDDREKTWKVALKDASKTGYVWTATYFLVDGSRKVMGPTNEQNLSVFLELPA